MGEIYTFVGTGDYFVLAGAAFWGIFCMVLVWTRVAQKRFKDEESQEAFLDVIQEQLMAGDIEAAKATCEGDNRAVPTMVGLALEKRDVEIEKLESWVMDRFQFDVMSDVESRINWISTIIKAAPMLGLIGTVAGMMGAFETLEKATAEEPTKQLLADIRMALEHTLVGLLITVTLLTGMATINNRIRKLEELAVFGMNRFFDIMRDAPQIRKKRAS